MNSLKNGLCFVGAVLLLVCIGVIVWYVLIYSQRPKVEQSGTLAFRESEILQMCKSEGPVDL